MYIGTSINNSAPLSWGKPAQISQLANFSRKFSSGKIAVCGTAGGNALGLIIPGQEDIKANEDVNVQIKDIGLWKTGDAVEAGAELTTDADGKAVTAVAGNFILAIALEAAAAKDTVIKAQVIKAGYKAGGEVAPLTLAGLTDVDITDIQDGDAIVYDATAEKYVNKALALEDLSDVEITEPEGDGDSLKYDETSGKWVNVAEEV